MHKLTFLLFVLSTSLLFAQTSHDTVDELIAIEKKRSEAIATNDLVYLKKLYADDFRGVTAIGYEVDKKTLMIVFGRDNPQTKFAIDQLKARVFGDSAIVTGRLTGTDSATGKTVHESLYMHIFQKRNDTWQIIAGQGTMIRRDLFPPDQK
jgi:ketosteroid isomerase-like protein